MSCHSCGPGAAERKMAKKLAAEMKKELCENLKLKIKRDLEERLGLKSWRLQNTRIWREKRFITVVELAKMAGVSPSTIRRIEAGLVIPGGRLTAAAKIERAMHRYPVREDPIVHCCSGLRGMIDRGWVKARKGTGMLDPDRLYFLIEIRGQETNIILHHCLTCGEDLYPAPISDVGDRGSSEKKK